MSNNLTFEEATELAWRWAHKEHAIFLKQLEETDDLSEKSKIKNFAKEIVKQVQNKINSIIANTISSKELKELKQEPATIDWIKMGNKEIK